MIKLFYNKINNNRQKLHIFFWRMPVNINETYKGNIIDMSAENQWEQQ